MNRDGIKAYKLLKNVQNTKHSLVWLKHVSYLNSKTFCFLYEAKKKYK